MEKQGLQIVASTVRKFNDVPYLTITGNRWFIGPSFYYNQPEKAAIAHCVIEALHDDLTQAPSPCSPQLIETILDALASICDPASIAVF